MNDSFIKYLCCPQCKHGELIYHSLQNNLTGIFICHTCKEWYITTDGILELLPRKLNRDNRSRFIKKYQKELTKKRVRLEEGTLPSPIDSNSVKQKLEQAKFFDVFFDKERKNYQDSSFWKAEYFLSLSPIKANLTNNMLVVDAGCGEGGCSFLLHKKGIKFIGFDISRHSIEKALAKSRRLKKTDDLFFFVGDAENPPLKANIAHYYILFAVLHHVVNPETTLKEANRIITRGGKLFIHDNNESIFRGLFDLLMKIAPLWEEKAAQEPLFSYKRIMRLVRNTDLETKIKTQVFFPPHLFNIFADAGARRLLYWSNLAASQLPVIKDNGGIIVVEALKKE